MTLVVVAGLMMAPLSAIFGAAAQDQVASPSNDEATPEKIRITAQRLISDISGNQAEFVGEVKASQGETEITADSLKIFFGDQSTSQNASPAQSLEKLIATGNVQIKFDNRLAVARQAVYITAQRVLILNGPGATVSSGENTITGETITFYRADGRFTVEGGSSGRVSAVILPEKSGLE
jgi:lipopolysaccharide export system protein LptA